MTNASTLTALEWNMIFSLPADSKPYHVEGVAFRAIHYPATKMKVEYVVAETRFGRLRRRFVGRKWQSTEYI